MPNMEKRATQLVKRGTKKVKRGTKAVTQGSIGKWAAEGARVAGRAYDTVKAKVVSMKRKRAIRRATKTTMDVAREVVTAAAVAGAVTAAVATVRAIRGKKRST